MKRSSFKAKRPWGDRHEVNRKARAPKPLVPKALGLSAAAKGPIRDRAHLHRVATHPCLICGQPYVQAHHPRECHPRTMGVRIGDDTCVPVCVLHHAEIHATNTDALWRRHRIDPKKWARDFYAETLKMRGDAR